MSDPRPVRLAVWPALAVAALLAAALITAAARPATPRPMAPPALGPDAYRGCVLVRLPAPWTSAAAVPARPGDRIELLFAPTVAGLHGATVDGLLVATGAGGTLSVAVRPADLLTLLDHAARSRLLVAPDLRRERPCAPPLRTLPGTLRHRRAPSNTTAPPRRRRR